MSDDIVQIWVGKNKVGVVDTQRIFAEVRDLSLTDENIIKDEIIRRTRQVNYIPSSVEAEYADALYREYQRFLGIAVEEKPDIIEIRILGPGCVRCEELMRLVMATVAELNLPADVQHIRDINEIARFGIVSTPALVFNGKIRAMGRVPSVNELKALLTENRMKEQD